MYGRACRAHLYASDASDVPLTHVRASPGRSESRPREE